MCVFYTKKEPECFLTVAMTVKLVGSRFCKNIKLEARENVERLAR